MGQNFDRPLFPKFEAPWVGDLHYMLKIAGEALGLLGCVLKRLKILMKFNSAGPVSKNVTLWDKTSHMLQNMKLHNFAFYLKMSKYVHFLFSTKKKYLCKFVSIKLIFSHFC